MPTASPSPPIDSPPRQGARDPKGPINGGPGSAGTVAYDQFVDHRIRQTRAAVKGAELASHGVRLLAGGLAFLLVAALIEHWAVTGGFSHAERLALFVLGLIGAGSYAARKLGPLLTRSVNPLYAAQEIERGSTGLKNSLVNLLQIRGGGAEPPAVRQTLERQAAERLASAGETDVDRTPLLRAAWALLALVAVVALYTVLSPKDFFASAGRVVLPWADIVAPTRVRIEGVEPGTVEAAQGERLLVTAAVSGLEPDDRVELVYSTADGRVVDQRVTMRRGDTPLRFETPLPPGGSVDQALGLQTDLQYRIEAGDARTPTYTLRVLASPTIAPLSVRYEYPAYTGLGPREVERVGDLRAIEGTRVTITAGANLPIESAQIDLRADGRPDVRMATEGDRATGRFTMRLSGDRPVNESTNYVLRFTSVDGQSNNQPPTYRLETIADLPPEAALLEPEGEETAVAVDQTVEIGLEARDPDYALRSVRLVGLSGERRVLRRELLDAEHRGRWFERVRFTPGEIGLRPGDVLDYWAEATDNKSPDPNRAESARRRLRVTGPANPNAGQGDDRQGDPGQQPNGAPDQQGERGEQGDANNGPGDPNQPRGPRQPDGADQPRGENDPSDPAGEGADPSQPQGEGAEGRPREDQSEQPDDPQQQRPGDSPPPGGLRGPSDEPAGGQNDQSSGGEGTSSDPSDDAGESRGASSDVGDNGADREQPTEGARPGDPGAGGEQFSPSDSQEPVAPDGSDDGAAFDRLREHFRQLDEQRNGDRGDPPPAERGEGGPAEGDQSDNATPQPGEPIDDAGQPGADETRGAPRDTPGAAPERDPAAPSAGQDERRGGQNDSQSSDPGRSAEPGQPTKQGSDPHEGTGESGENQAADEGGGQSGDRGPGESSGQPGDEQQSDTPTGRPGDRQGEGSSSREAPGETGEGAERPNQTGEGQQNAPSPGEESSDRGRPDQQRPGEGQSGEGQPSDGQPGDGQPGESGQPSQDPPTQRDGATGDPGARSGRPGEPSEGDPPTGERGERPRDPSQGPEADRGGDRPGEGAPGDNPGGEVRRPQAGDPTRRTPQEAEDQEPAEPGGDAANLEYARKQTELVLERLEEQLAEREADRSLLDKLGWTEDELRRFLQRWREREAAASRGGGDGSQLDDALRSLGLKPTGPTATSRTPQDDLRDLRERARTAVPPRLRDTLQWYNRSLNRTGPGADPNAGAPSAAP